MKLFFFITAFFINSLVQAQLSPMTLEQAQNLLSADKPQVIQDSLAQTPGEYSFYNTHGENTVSYTGQVMRQVLIHDAKLVFGSMNRAQYSGQFDLAFGKLNSLYEYNKDVDSARPFLVQAKDEQGGQLSIYEGSVYGDIFPRAISLQSKMAGIDNDLRKGALLGWNNLSFANLTLDQDSNNRLTPHELMTGLMRVIANNASSGEASFFAKNGNLEPQEIRGAHITRSGVDLAQMTQKLLHSALSFSQMAGDYLSVDLAPGKGLLGDNEAFVERKDDSGNLLITLPYTVLQHHWDEAFGYFGAARNYLDYTDLQTRSGFSIDAYEALDIYDSIGDIAYIDQIPNAPDLEISLMSEKNLGLSINASKRDLGASLGNTNFNEEIMNAFLKGRQLIQDKPSGYLNYAQAYAVVAAHGVEQVIAATALHYVNAVISDLNKYGTAEFEFPKLAKHYGEMKGFALAFQFNPMSEMTESDFVRTHQLMGDYPVDPSTGDIIISASDLVEARQIVIDSFGFDQENGENW